MSASRLTPERRAVARVLLDAERRPGRLDRELRVALAGLEGRAAARGWMLAYSVLRHRTLLDARLAPLLKKPFAKQTPAVRTALRLGAAELSLLDGVPDRAAVDQAVEAVRALGAPEAAGFVNAVLRRYARGDAAPELPDRDDDPLAWAEVATSHPRWIVERMAARLGPEQAAAWCEADNAEPPLVLRFRSDAAPAHREGTGPGRWAAGSARPIERLEGGVEARPGFMEGAFWVQDEAAQAAAGLVRAAPGMRILDACAAPGGKSFHLADTVGPTGSVHAIDKEPRRLAELVAGRDRLRLPWISTEVRHLAARPWRQEEGTFDAVLLDAPCSGLGVIRRHPDIRWSRRASDLVGFAARQRKLLAAVAPAVRPGGALVYSVCTFTEEETDGALRAFLAAPEGADFELDPPEPGECPPAGSTPEGTLRTYPHRDDADGFFAARLRRRS